MSIASGLRRPDDVFSTVSGKKSNYKYKKIDRNFKNTLTGVGQSPSHNYEYDAFQDQTRSQQNGLYDFLKKTQNVSTPKSQTSYQAAFGVAPSTKSGAGGGDGSAYRNSNVDVTSKVGSNYSRTKPISASSRPGS